MGSKVKNVNVTRENEKQSGGSLAGHPRLAGLRDEIDRLFDQFLERGWLAPYAGLWEPLPSTGEGRFRNLMELPRADLSESDTEFELTVELPGMSGKDIEVTVTDKIISLKGEKRSEHESREKDYYIAERSYGSVRRDFAMPSGVDAGKVTASFSKGILKLRMPKTKEGRSKSRRLDIKAE